MEHNNFEALLRGEKHRLTIFEPFPTRDIVTKLIWRGGDELWSTMAHRTETLIGFYKYIKSDVAIIEPRGELEAVLSAELPEGMKFVIISDDQRELQLAVGSEKVCALATRGEFFELNKPMILLQSEDESADETLSRAEKFDAVYLRSMAASRRGKIILGGIGSEFINERPPLDIYDLVRKLSESGEWAVGSGGFGEGIEYLGFISMLGIYNKLREE